jgi:metallo-beta-lactamase class B
MVFATHFHEDRTAGLEYYKGQGIRTYTTKRTDELSKKTNKKRSEYRMENDSTFLLGEYTFHTYYPGHGHAPDNIVIWFEKQKILYGGCLVKSTDDSTLGNLGDADVKTYATTVKNVIDKFKKPRFVIPGHNSWQDPGSLQHTYNMAKELGK